MGRFLSRDPIRAGYNWYAYCENDPVNAVDPTELSLEGRMLAVLWDRQGEPLVELTFSQEFGAQETDLRRSFAIGIRYALEAFGTGQIVAGSGLHIGMSPDGRNSHAQFPEDAGSPFVINLSRACVKPYGRERYPASVLAEFVHEVAHLHFGRRNGALMEALALAFEFSFLEEITAAPAARRRTRVYGGGCDEVSSGARKALRQHYRRRWRGMRSWLPEPLRGGLDSPAGLRDARLYLRYRSDRLHDGLYREGGQYSDPGALWLAARMLQAQGIDWPATVGIAERTLLVMVRREDGNQAWAWVLDAATLPAGMGEVAACLVPGARSGVVARRTEGWWPFRLWEGVTFLEDGGWTTLLPANNPP